MKCGYECDKFNDTGQYLDFENSKCRKKLFDKLVEDCSKNINEDEMIHNDYGNIVCNIIAFIYLLH